MDDSDRTYLSDSFARDMAETQRSQGKMPTPSVNARLAVPLFERLERKQEDARLRIQPKPVTAPRPERPRGMVPVQTTHQSGATTIDRETGQVRELRDVPLELGYKMVHHHDDDEPATLHLADPIQIAFFERMSARVGLLLSKRESGPLGQPSWRKRVYEIMSTRAVRRFTPNQRKVALVALCEESNETFGDWKKDPADSKPILFT